MLAVRDRELKDVSGWGRFLTEARCRVNRCKLLARMGHPREEELAAAQTKARRRASTERGAWLHAHTRSKRHTGGIRL